MIFLCFVETRTSAVPHMEPMPVDTIEDARVYARRILGDHQDAIAAHIFRDEERVGSVAP